MASAAARLFFERRAYDGGRGTAMQHVQTPMSDG
jgi:hypothetical protein